MDMTTNKIDTLYHIDAVTDSRIFEDELDALAYSGGQKAKRTLEKFDSASN